MDFYVGSHISLMVLGVTGIGNCHLPKISFLPFKIMSPVLEVCTSSPLSREQLTLIDLRGGIQQ